MGEDLAEEAKVLGLPLHGDSIRGKAEEAPLVWLLQGPVVEAGVGAHPEPVFGHARPGGQQGAGHGRLEADPEIVRPFRGDGDQVGL